MNLLLLHFLTFIKVSSTNLYEQDNLTIQRYSNEDLLSVFNQYRNDLNLKISNMSIFPKIKDTLVEDLDIANDLQDQEYNVAVLDVGGSFFKIAMVNIKKVDDKFRVDITSLQSYPYPSNSEVLDWYTWVADKYLSYMKYKEFQPDFASLIFSYPIQYENGKKAKPMVLSKYWCFENTNILKSDLQENLNKSILSKIQNQSFSTEMKNKKDNFLVRSVLNDSVATLLSSKVITDKKAIGVVLGTGTNGAFTFEMDGKSYVYNTEWGAFIPQGINLLPEEKLFIDSLKTKYNFLDVLIGNGYKCGILNEIIKNRGLHIKKVEGHNIGEIMSRSTDDLHRKLVDDLIFRSRQLIIAMVCATIKVTQSSNVTILLNGSAYGNLEERMNFITYLHKYAKEIFNLKVDVTVAYKEGLTFYGAAYYALAKYLQITTH